MTYNIDKNENLQFGFGRRVERPGGDAHGSWQVMPFPTNVYNEQFIFVGNPYLQPEYSNQYDLNYSRPIPMGFASLSLFYHDIENKIEWYDDDSYGDIGDVLTFRNVDEAQSTGISFFGMIILGSLFITYMFRKNNDIQKSIGYFFVVSWEAFLCDSGATLGRFGADLGTKICRIL